MLVDHDTLYFAFIDCNTCLRALIFPLDTPLGFFFLPELCIQLGVIVLEVYRKGKGHCAPIYYQAATGSVTLSITVLS